MQETQVQSQGWKDLLEKGMATHSSILAWGVPWTAEPSGLQPTGLQSQTQPSDSHTHTHKYKTLGTHQHFGQHQTQSKHSLWMNSSVFLLHT